MTSVPKPLKFLRPHFAPLKTYYATAKSDGPNRIFLADVLSVLAMNMGNTFRCDSLRFKLRGSKEATHLCGHEYVRHLAGEIAREYRTITMADSAMRDDDEPTPTKDPADIGPKLERATLPDISRLVADIISFLISSNTEPEAVDILMEIDCLPDLVAHADKYNYSRVCLYLMSCVDYLPELDEVRQLLNIAADIYLKVEKLPDVMQVAQRTNDLENITKIYTTSATGSTVRLQLALDLGRENVLLDGSDEYTTKEEAEFEGVCLFGD